MIELALVGMGFLLGLVVGRWPVLVLAVALGVWIALVSEVDDVPAWFLGLAYVVIAGAGLALGVAARGFAVKRREERRALD